MKFVFPKSQNYCFSISEYIVIFVHKCLYRYKIPTGHPQKQPFADVLQICVLKNISNFTGKHLCWNLFFNKVTSLRPATLFKKSSSTGFPENIAKFFRTAFLWNTSGGSFFNRGNSNVISKLFWVSTNAT